jgi:F0F1-type ATP synthase assembly protein I
MRERKPLPKRAPWYDYTSASSIGIEIVVAITVPTLGAYWLERNVTHWRPWTTLLGFATGIGAAVLALARVIRQHEMAVEARKRAEAGERTESDLDGGPDDDHS